MKGEPPAPQLSSEIQPALNLFQGVENRYLFGWNKYSAFVDKTGGAAQFSGFRLRNPAAANALAVVEFVAVSVTASMQIIVGQETIATNFATVSGASRLDARLGTAGAASSACIVSSDTNAGILAVQIGSFLVAANQLQQLIQNENQEIPLLPGDAFEIGAGTANQRILVWVMWRERFLEDSERT